MDTDTSVCRGLRNKRSANIGVAADEAGVVGARQSNKERLQVGGTSPERLPALAWPGRTMIAKPGSILLAGGQQDVTGRAALAAHRDRSRGAQMGIPGRLSNRRYRRRAEACRANEAPLPVALGWVPESQLRN